jgi:hypothetical protein
VSILILSETTIMMNAQTLGKTFRASNVLANEQARKFWRQSFGDNRFSIPWERFAEAFQLSFGRQEEKNMALLHTALNSNNDRTISVYEFAHFSDILGPARYEEGRLQAKRVFFYSVLRSKKKKK